MQEDEGSKRYPAHFGSITLNDHERRYSQAKLELFGLFWALHDVRLYIFGVRNLVIEVDARRPKAEGDPKVDEEEYEDWVDECGAFAIELVNRCKPKSHLLCPPEIPLLEYYSPSSLPQDIAIFTASEIPPETSKTEILQSEKVKQRDERLEVVKEFLGMKKLPDGLEEKELESLVQLAT
ncbi:hypothetical protein PISMIDRAFT_7180 [Pisolithus microcarpus 441]|uniref:Reverse transcriptase RNase H-like domain-containing protein n=1 Tax=Pisolithus microcarpus 441 TaxID=765257 RepID=A0A0D0A2L0_9AGAM|nr:hypothetical protein PISMIDRAFT_7180 [Pisolithus microcarpus 441]